MINFFPVSEDDVPALTGQVEILLVTATSVETEALHVLFTPLPSHSRCQSLTIDAHTYYVGRLGRYGVVHVQCQMGSVAPGASLSTVTAALTKWHVKAVVMVGIAFGVSRQKQRIGDVLLSRTVIPYEIKRVGSKLVVPRGPIPPCGTTLLDRFSNSSSWDHNISPTRKARILPAQLLSGESLVDNELHRAELLAQFPQAEGGEMEGAGVFAAAHDRNIEWILVKSICDFADGKKSRGKAMNQRTAAASAASLCKHVFSQPRAFAALGCTELSSRRRITPAVNLTDNQVLFEVYEPSYESAYLERDVDIEIRTLLAHQGIWVSGPSGCGKTTVLRRNMAQAARPWDFIDLSKCIGANVPQLLECLLYEFAERLGVSLIQPTTAKRHRPGHYYVDQISTLLAQQGSQARSFLIDEVPLAGAEFDAFAQKIAAIVITLANRNLCSSSLSLATIGDPRSSLTQGFAKLHEHMRLLPMTYWPITEVSALISHVSKLLPLHLSFAQKSLLAKAASGSPRKAKSMLKTWLMFRNTTGWSLDRVIAETPDSPT